MAKERVDMEGLVHWAYGRQKAHMAARSGAAPCGPQAFGSPWLTFARLLELGTLIDDGGGTECAGGDQCPNDALTIHGRALALDADAWFLVYHNGRSMTLPDWYPAGVGHEVPLLNGKGQRRPIYRDVVNRTGIIQIPVPHTDNPVHHPVRFACHRRSVSRTGIVLHRHDPTRGKRVGHDKRAPETFDKSPPNVPSRFGKQSAINNLYCPGKISYQTLSASI